MIEPLQKAMNKSLDAMARSREIKKKNDIKLEFRKKYRAKETQKSEASKYWKCFSCKDYHEYKYSPWWSEATLFYCEQDYDRIEERYLKKL